MKLFKLNDDSKSETYVIKAIQDREGFKEIRSSLANSYEIDDWCPKIEVTDADIKGDRTLTLTYYRSKGRNIGDSYAIMMKHLHRLWGHKIKLVTGRGHVIGEYKPS